MKTLFLSYKFLIGLMLAGLASGCQSMVYLKPVVGGASAAQPMAAMPVAVVVPDPARHLQVVLTLRRGTPHAAPIAWQLPVAPLLPQAPLSRTAFNQQCRASKADVAKVEKFALKYGLRLLKTNRMQRVIELDGTVAEVEQAFGVVLKQYGVGSHSYLSTTSKIQLPAKLQKVVVSVLGLQNFPLTSSVAAPAVGYSARQSAYNGYSGAQMAALYHFPVNTTGKGQCIGLVELNGGYSLADLKQYFHLTNAGPLPTVTSVRVAAVDTPTTGFKETSLDLQVAASAAPGAHYAVYFGQNTKSGFLQALAAAVHDSINQPSVISISWGNAEIYWSAQEMAGFEELLQDAALLSVTVILSTGDMGSTCGLHDGAQHVQFPASSPYVLACGGTSITVQADTISNEVVWSNYFAQSGGGFSDVYVARPAFQQPVVADTVKNWLTSRGIPDVSFHADNYSGYLLILNNQPTTDGGTSAAAPLCAALIARLNEALGTHLGYINSLLYDARCRLAFRPTTQGSNGGYYSARGPWNPCTGLGSVDGERLLQCLRIIRSRH